MLEAGICVIASGGGGIPVVADVEGNLSGINAVIDKDLSSALLANELSADLLIILTAVDNVYLDFNKPTQRKLDCMTIEQAGKYLVAGHFATGSMLPKIQSALRFLKNGGQEVIITGPEFISEAVTNGRGTHIVP